ncbi:hypothetical protein L0F63_003169, partial [Massospora cicadina]
LFSCLEVLPTYAGYFAAKVLVLLMTAFVLFIVRTYQDVIFGGVFVWFMFWLSIKNSQLEDEDPRLQLYRAAIFSGSAVLLLIIVAFLRNIYFCVKRYKLDRAQSLYSREE